MSANNFWNNFSYGFMHGMFNSNPFFGCCGGWMNPFGGFGNFGAFGGFGGGIFGCNTRFLYPNMMSCSFFPLMQDFPMPSFPPVDFSFPDNIWDNASTGGAITQNYNMDTFVHASSNPSNSSTNMTTKLSDSTPPVVSALQEEVIDTKKKISLSRTLNATTAKGSTKSVETSKTQGSSVISGSLKSKHWTAMSDAEMIQVYGNYNRDITSRYKGTAAELNKYLKGKGKLENCGQAFIDAQNKYGISASVLVGIAMNESGKGTSSLAKTKNNVGGVRISGSYTFKTYGTVGACIDDMARFLKNGYVNNKGRALTKLYQINAKYCPVSDKTDSSGVNAYWARNVEKYAKEVDSALA